MLLVANYFVYFISVNNTIELSSCVTENIEEDCFSPPSAEVLSFFLLDLYVVFMIFVFGLKMRWAISSDY